LKYISRRTSNAILYEQVKTCEAVMR
jgi:hypothetical protein